MYEENYRECVDKIKEVYPQFKDVSFVISNGILSYTSGIWSLINQINMTELQKFVNEFLLQKVYRITYTAYLDVYARSEEEAREFSNHIRVNPTRTKIDLTDLETTLFGYE